MVYPAKASEEGDIAASLNTLGSDLMDLGTALSCVRDRLSGLSERIDESYSAVFATLERLEDEIADLRRAPRGFRHVDSLTEEIEAYGMPRSILITGIRTMTAVPVRRDSVSDFTFTNVGTSSQPPSVLQLDADGLIIPTLSTSTPARRSADPTTPGVTFVRNTPAARGPASISSRSENFPTPKEVADSIAHLPEGRKWYVVSQGRRPGVYPTSLDATPEVIGISNSACIRVKGKAAALAQYAMAYAKGNVRVRLT